MKDTRIIAIGNQKGGCGKSMLSFQIGAALAAYGSRVMIADGDAQRTLRRMADMAKALKSPFGADVVPVSEYGGRVHDALSFYIGAYDFILIDSPPALESPVFRSALLAADLAVIPVIPSPPDLWSAVGTREMLTIARETNTRLSARLVLNRCKNTLLRRAVIEQVIDLGIPVMNTRIHDRTAYEEAWAHARGVMDLRPRPREAVVEISGLLEEILTLFLDRTRVAAE